MIPQRGFWLSTDSIGEEIGRCDSQRHRHVFQFLRDIISHVANHGVCTQPSWRTAVLTTYDPGYGRIIFTTESRPYRLVYQT